MALHNKINKEELKVLLENETFFRRTLSFYKYVILTDVAAERDAMFVAMQGLNIFGRVYVAHEGINAQISVPEHNWEAFLAYFESVDWLRGTPMKIAIEDNGKSFYKLIVRVKDKIVADGLDDSSFDVTNTGTRLDAADFNRALDEPGTVVVDIRNHYESEIGHFEHALCPDADTFREELPMVRDMLDDKKDNKILLYCTGGIRCEKASAYLRHHGFSNVFQLHGGIIEYARQVKEQGLESKFKGKNFVFDQRMGEKITGEVVSHCHQCGSLCDVHVNCKNDDCHLLFIQCDNCKVEMEGCCSAACVDIIHLPIEEQRKIRKGRAKEDCLAVYKSRLRPKAIRLK